MANGAPSSAGVTETEAEAAEDHKEVFRLNLHKHFSSLRCKGMGANEAAALALRIASGTADEPVTGRELLQTIREAKGMPSPDLAARMVAATFASPERLGAAFRAAEPKPLSAGIDYPVLWEFYKEIIVLGSDAVTAALMSSADRLLVDLTADVNGGAADASPNALRPLLVILENPLLMEPDYHSQLEKLNAILVALPVDGQLRLIKILESFTKGQFEVINDMLQQLITVSLYEASHQFGAAVEGATKVLGFLFAANEKALALPHTAFYNDAVNDEDFNIEEDYSRSKQHDRFTFSFCDHPFVYDPASKSKILQLDSQLQMIHHFEDAMLRSYFSGPAMGASCPFNVLRIRRDHLIQDAIAQVSRRSEDLKKPLKVQFVGEEGVDEGGVQKEFFQLVVREIFDPKYGMFSCNEETGLYWFSAALDGMQMEYELIGTVLGLAIYNNNILDFRFPCVIYKKLLEKTRTLADLATVDPGLAKGLGDLLAFTGDVEATYQRSFQVSVEDLFGGITTVDLKEGGGDVPVTGENCDEFVKLCVEFFLDKSVARPFDAFAKGFLRVCGGPILKKFQPEELEQLICGSPVLDFEALESCVKYENGYRRDSRIINEFWELVHAFSQDERKRLLFFTTGSDRAPIKGLASLPFIISRNGPDSHRLPTAHTCFNHLLLPDYSTKEKMREKLITAINNAEGFGLM